MVIALIAANEPLTPKLFLVVVVILLVKLTIELAGRTTPVLRRRPRPASVQRPTTRGISRSAPLRPAWFDALAQGHSRWTPPSFWARMLVDLTPLTSAERRSLVAERDEGVQKMLQFINIDDDEENNSA
jgi:hypothetical protein